MPDRNQIASETIREPLALDFDASTSLGARDALGYGGDTRLWVGLTAQY